MAVLPQMMARGLKFQIKKVERLYGLCSANQLCSICAADLYLSFDISK